MPDEEKVEKVVPGGGPINGHGDMFIMIFAKKPSVEQACTPVGWSGRMSWYIYNHTLLT